MTVNSDEAQPLVKRGKDAIVPEAPWAASIASRRNPSRHLPQAIAHRGYKAAWPENSMGAFRGAVQVGAHAIETDLHLSADGVVVLSHDAKLKRCFGVDRKIADCSWEYLSSLQTTSEPRQGMPRLVDLLTFLTEPGKEKTWLLLDIKLDDEPNALVSGIADAVARVPSSIPWNERIILGCWNATLMKTCHRILPSFPMAHISFSPLYSSYFLPVPNLGFNLLQRSLVGPLGRYFLRAAQRAGRPLFAWVVNDVKTMEWCIRKNNAPHRKPHLMTRNQEMDLTSQLGDDNDEGPSATSDGSQATLSTTDSRLIDGVITDDPKLFLEVCSGWEDELDGKRARPREGLVSSLGGGISTLLRLVRWQAMFGIFYLATSFMPRKFDVLRDPKRMQ